MKEGPVNQNGLRGFFISCSPFFPGKSIMFEKQMLVRYYQFIEFFTLVSIDLNRVYVTL